MVWHRVLAMGTALASEGLSSNRMRSVASNGYIHVLNKVFPRRLCNSHSARTTFAPGVLDTIPNNTINLCFSCHAADSIALYREGPPNHALVPVQRAGGRVYSWFGFRDNEIFLAMWIGSCQFSSSEVHTHCYSFSSPAIVNSAIVRSCREGSFAFDRPRPLLLSFSTRLHFTATFTASSLADRPIPTTSLRLLLNTNTKTTRSPYVPAALSNY